MSLRILGAAGACWLCAPLWLSSPSRNGSARRAHHPIQVGSPPVMDTTPAFDEVAATNKYLARISAGGARARRLF